MRLLIIGGEAFQALIGNAVLRLFPDIETAADEREAKEKLKWQDLDAVVYDDDFSRTQGREITLEFLKILKESHRDFIVVSSRKEPSDILEAANFGAADYITRPFNQREFVLRFNAVVQKKTRLACIGGGTGLFNLLLGLKTLPNLLLTSIVSMSDDGGSSGKLSQTLGILPPGDIRRSLVALSNAPELMNQIMQYRFAKKGDLEGHSFGNIFLAVLAEVKGSMAEAVRAISDILNIQGIVLPATRSLASLVARFEDGTLVKGESNIDLGIGRPPDLKITELWHEPDPETDADAYASIINADVVTIGPGDLFTSVAANLAVRNIQEAVRMSKAKKVYVCNLMTKPGETSHYSAADHVKEILKFLGGDLLDYVIISNTKLSDDAVTEYSKKDQSPVLLKNTDELKKMTKAQVILADVGSETELVRHDSKKLGAQIQSVIEKLSS